MVLADVAVQVVVSVAVPVAASGVHLGEAASAGAGGNRAAASTSSTDQSNLHSNSMRTAADSSDYQTIRVPHGASSVPL